jgi:hypothetical protein
MIAGLALVAAGCGGGSDDPGGSSSPSSSPSSPSDAPEPEPTPTVEPADGPVLEVGALQVSALEKWRINNESPFAVTAFGPVDDGRSGGLLLGAIPEDQMSLARTMRYSWQPGPKPPGFQKQPSTVLGGLTASYYTAEASKFLTEHVLSLWDSGYVVEVNISLPEAMPMQRQQEIVESIRLSYDRVGS